MRKILLAIAIIFTSMFVFTSLALPAHAQGPTIDPCSAPVDSEGNPTDPDFEAPWWCLDVNQFGSYFGTILNFVFALAVIIALGFLIFGGIKWITSGGDKGGVEGARNTIIAAIIGLIIVFLSYLIVNFVLVFLTGNSISQITIPSL